MAVLMVILIIIAIIVAIFYIPAIASIDINDESKVDLKWLFWDIRIFPLKETNKKTETKKEVSKTSVTKKPSKEKKQISSEEFSEYLVILKEIIFKFKGYAKELLRGIKIEKVYLNWRVGGEDACETALNYGKYNAAFYAVYMVLANIVSIKLKKINITPDFTAEKSKLDFSCKMLIIPARIIGSTCTFGFRMLSEYIQSEVKNKNLKNEKVVDENEPTTSN